MSNPDRLITDELVTRAARGLGKVDLLGARGITLVNAEEIEAMAGLLAVMGLVPIYPGAPVPETLFITPQKET